MMTMRETPRPSSESYAKESKFGYPGIGQHEFTVGGSEENEPSASEVLEGGLSNSEHIDDVDVNTGNFDFNEPDKGGRSGDGHYDKPVTTESTPACVEGGDLTPELMLKIQACFDNPTYAHKHSLILDLVDEVKSFEVAVEQLLKLAESNVVYSDLAFSLIRNTLQYYTTPNEFPVERIREIQKQTTNDMQWQDFEAFVKLREDVFDMKKYQSHDARYIISIIGKDICFDIKKTRSLAIEFMSVDEDCRYQMLGAVYDGLCKMYANYPGEKEPPIAVEMFEEYERMDNMELIESLNPGYAYNLVMEYIRENSLFHDDDVVRSMLTEIHLSEPEIHKKLTTVIADNIDAYQYAGSLVEMQSKYPYDTSHYLQSYVFPDLSREARSRHSEDLDQRHNFLLNCSSLAVKKRLLMFSPEGDVLGITKQLPESKKKIDVTTALKMSTFLLDDNQPRKITAVATALAFFDDLPKDLQEEVWQITTQAHPDLDWQRYFAPEAPYSFETAVWCAEEVARYFPDNLYDKIGIHINTILATGMKELPFVDFEEVSTVAKEMEEEFGKETFDAEQMQKTFKTMNFQTVVLLKEDAGVDFNEMSLREFFILLNILQKNKQGKGFKKIKTLLGGDKTQEQKTNRLRSLLALELDANMEDVILKIETDLRAEVSDKVFAKFSELASTIGNVDSVLKQNINSHEDGPRIIARIKKTILQKANDLLMHSYEVLNGLDFQYQMSLAAGVVDRSFDENSDEYWEREFKKMEQEEIQKLEDGIEQIRVDNTVFTAAFSTLRKEGFIAEGGDVDLLSSALFETIEPLKLSSDDKQRMLQIFDENWAQESPDFKMKVRSGLEASFDSEKTKFYVLRHNSRVVGYARADDQSEGLEPHMHFGSFNVDKSYKDSRIGEFIYKELIAQSVKRYDRVEADCDPKSDISKFYLRDFVATEYYLAGGVKPSLHIVYDKEQYGKTAYSNLDEQRIIEHAESASYKSGDVVMRVIEYDDNFPELNKGKILTRYFKSKQTGKTYGVFEQYQVPLKKAS